MNKDGSGVEWILLASVGYDGSRRLSSRTFAAAALGLPTKLGVG
jgi:hypothetical protein